MSRDIKDLYEPIRAKATRVLAELNRAEGKRGNGITWKITETRRTAARQRQLYNQGRSTPGPIVTYRDGVKKLSNHQYGLAFDLAPFKVVGGKEVLCYDDPKVNWDYVAHCIRAEGLISGRDWNNNGSSKDERFLDSPHAEWNQKDRVTYRAAWAWVRSLKE